MRCALLVACAAIACILLLVPTTASAAAHSSSPSRPHQRKLHQIPLASAANGITPSTVGDPDVAAAMVKDEIAALETEIATEKAANAASTAELGGAPEEEQTTPKKKEPTPAEAAKAAAALAVAAAKPEPTTAAGIAAKSALIDAAVASLNADGKKADDKETEAKFARQTSRIIPKGGVRLIKDLLTGKLSAVPKPMPIVPSGPAAEVDDERESRRSVGGFDGLFSKQRGGLQERISAVVAAALARKDASINAVNLPTESAADKTTGGKSKSEKKHNRHAGMTNLAKSIMGRGSRMSSSGKPLHIHVGSSIATPDIISNGVLAPKWNISEESSREEAKDTEVSTEKDFSDFYLWRTFEQGDRANRVITGQKPFVFVNNSEIVEVKVTAWGAKQHMTPIPLVNATELALGAGIQLDKRTKKPIKKNELLFSVQYECHAEGTALVTIVLRLFELTTGQRSSTSLSWTFLKHCSRPNRFAVNETNTEGNAAVPGLTVGTRANQSDVVEHGEAKKEWTFGSEGALHTLHTYPPEVEGAKFWMRYEPPVANATVEVNRAVFIVEDPTVLLLEDSGDLTEQVSTLRAGRTYTLSLTFTCKKEGHSNVTVAFHFPGVEGSKVSYSFRKDCSGLQVGDGAIMNGIDIWLNEDSTDREPEVVKNGLVRPEYRPIQNLSLEADALRAAGADGETDHVSFFVRLRPLYHAVEYDSPVVESYSVTGEVILRPTITGSIQESSKLVDGKARFLVLSFNCIKQGEAVVTIKIPFRPSGSIQFNIRKMCTMESDEQIAAAEEVKEYSTGDQLTPLPGINIGFTMDADNVVKDGITLPEFHHNGTAESLLAVPKKYPFVNFFLWKDTTAGEKAKDIRFGRPELISTADIARPVITGLGAEGGIVADNEFSSIGVTFHCFTAGNTTITLVIPLTADEWLNALNEPVSIPPARKDPIKISFVKECPEAHEEPVTGMGGVGISGFSIGFAPNTSELVYNGFPQPKYFGQRTTRSGVHVPKEVESSTLYLHYSSQGIANKLVGKEVLFQAPLIIAHNPTARPALAGAAAAGGVLLRDGPAMPLDLTYNCRYAGEAVLTVIIPIIPHGQISVTIPKYCIGDAAPHGVKVTGLHVGLTPTTSEVVQDGQTTRAYVSYATKKSAEHKVGPEEDVTSFYIRKTGDAIKAMEPLIYAQKPIVNMRVTHQLLPNSTAVDDDVDGDDIEIDEQGGWINITYACVHAGKTDITLSLNLYPKGQVQWTFEKQCAESEVNHGPLLDAGIKPGGDSGYSREERTEANYAKYFEGDGKQPAQPLSGGIGTTYPEEDWGFNPHSSLDHTDASHRAAYSSRVGLSALQIGTGKTGEHLKDVFSRSLPDPRYKIATNLDISKYAVIKPDHETSTFWISTTSGTLNFGQPRIKLGEKFKSYLSPTLDGPGAKAGSVAVGDAPVRLDIAYHCSGTAGGVFAVGVHIPIGAEVAMFRVIKICPSYDLQEEAGYITAGKMMTLIGIFIALIALAAGSYFFRKVYLEKKGAQNALYAPVSSQETN